MIVIDRAQPDEWLAALRLAFRRLPDEKRRDRVLHALHLVDVGALDPDGFLLARQGAQLVGVQVCVPLGGATCLFWLPETSNEFARGDVRDRLVQAGLAWCRSQGGRLAQAILPPEDAPLAAPLVRQGFARVTRLHYLQHHLERFDDGPDDLRVEPFRDEALFRAALGRTYEGTLDCPELNGVRSLDDVLAGYRAAGPFDPNRWWLAYRDGRPAGVVVLTEIPEGPAWDLSYLGVVPEARGRGVGRGLVRRVLRAAREADVTRVLLAVDERNTPARRLYASLGFEESDVRDVYLFFFA